MNEEEQRQKVNAFENTDKTLNLAVPAKAADLSDDDLNRVVGGDSIDSGQQGG